MNHWLCLVPPPLHLLKNDQVETLHWRVTPSSFQSGSEKTSGRAGKRPTGREETSSYPKVEPVTASGEPNLNTKLIDTRPSAAIFLGRICERARARDKEEQVPTRLGCCAAPRRPAAAGTRPEIKPGQAGHSHWTDGQTNNANPRLPYPAGPALLRGLRGVAGGEGSWNVRTASDRNAARSVVSRLCSARPARGVHLLQ